MKEESPISIKLSIIRVALKLLIKSLIPVRRLFWYKLNKNVVLGPIWQLLERKPAFPRVWSSPEELQWIWNCRGSPWLHRQQDIQSGGSYPRYCGPANILLTFLTIISDSVHNLYEKNSVMDSWKTHTLNPYNGRFFIAFKNQLNPTGRCHTLLPNVQLEADMLQDGILLHFDPEMSYRVIIHDPKWDNWYLLWTPCV